MGGVNIQRIFLYIDVSILAILPSNLLLHNFKIENIFMILDMLYGNFLIYLFSLLIIYFYEKIINVVTKFLKAYLLNYY
jgi:hypothetical protein